MVARTLMLMGTRSNVGKSVLCAGLCRYFSRAGLRVAPFKAMNLSLNAAITRSGGEIGRSTFAQSEAAGVEATTAMNPVLIKPEANQRSQIVLDGVAVDESESASWPTIAPRLWKAIERSLAGLREQFDLIVIEGSGSPAEPNLRQNDLSNMRLAHHAEAPVVLVGDIELGGVFASLLGTLTLLAPADRQRVKGMIVNRHRGDVSLFGDYLTDFQRQAFGTPVLGIVPFLDNLCLPTEDGLPPFPRPANYQVDVAIVAYPHIANTDEFQPLAHEGGVRVRFVHEPAQLGTPQVVILPGSKSTLEDLEWLESSGMARAIVVGHRDDRIPVLGLCGGYQMLGQSLHEEGRSVNGLGLLPVTTRFQACKQTRQVTAHVPVASDAAGPSTELRIKGYEIHTGQTEWNISPMSPEWECQNFCEVVIGDRDPHPDGCVARGNDGQTASGTYVHGLFEDDAFRETWLRSLGWEGCVSPFDRPATYDRLADTLSNSLAMKQLQQIIEAPHDG